MRTESFHADDLANALRRSKIATMPELKKALGAVKKFAEMEGLDAHGWSAEIRLRAAGKGRREKDEG